MKKKSCETNRVSIVRNLRKLWVRQAEFFIPELFKAFKTAVPNLFGTRDWFRGG